LSSGVALCQAGLNPYLPICISVLS
jgi:hypothetical protein